MADIADIVVDCTHPGTLARFWAEVLDGYQVAPYDDAELARLRAAGIEDVADDPTVLVEGGTGRPRMWFVKVPEAKTVKNRIHLDLRHDQPEVELTRLTHLGARVTAEFDKLTVLEDPEGNEFCLLKH